MTQQHFYAMSSLAVCILLLLDNKINASFLVEAFTSNSRIAIHSNHQRIRPSPTISSSSSPFAKTRLYAASVNPAGVNSIPKLDKWKILPNGSLVGTVAGHPAIDDGDVITTSPIDDPDAAKTQAIVTTASGTQYKLLVPLASTRRGTQPTPSFDQQVPQQQANGSSVNGSSGKIRAGPEWRKAVMEYKLNSSTVGLEEEYLLAGKPTRSTSGKSNIWEAYRANDDNGLPNGDPPVCVKISSNLEAVSREYENYRKLSFLGISTRGQFVNCLEFFPVAGYDKRFRGQCALVLEMGARDLKSYLDARGKLSGNELRDACVSAAQCVQALHNVGLVWTDLKTENFVVMGDGEVKGIDLESAMPVGDNPVDYSPEACPPEFADAFLSGDGPYFELSTSYDIWSLGMMMLELATGGGYFDGKNPAQITKMLRDFSLYEDRLDVSAYTDEIEDEKLKDLISRCLSTDPKKRPSSAQVLIHPYFLAAGPLSWMTSIL